MAISSTRKKPPPPLDKQWAWMIVLGVFIYAFFMVGLAKSYGLLLLAFQQKFEVSTAVALLPMSVSAFVYAFGAPTALIIGERITPQRVIIFGAVVGLIGLALSSLLVSMPYVIVMYGVSVGIGNSSFYGNGLVMLGKYFRKFRTLATGMGLAGASIGQFLMPLIIDHLLESYGLGGTLLIISALYFHAAISGFLFRPIESYGPEEVVKAEVKQPQANGEGQLAKTNKEFNSADKDDGIARPLLNNGPNGTLHSTDQNNIEEISNKNDADADKRYDENRSDQWDDSVDDQFYIQRRAMLTSTGSVYLVSPSVQDVSNIDEKAHKVDIAKSKSLTGWRRVIDFTVLKSYITLFFTLASFLCFFGYFNFILLLPPICQKKGFRGFENAALISACGVGDLIARISTGIFADLNLVARYKIKSFACLLCGVNIFVILFADTFYWLAFHSFMYGLVGGSYVCLMSVVLVDFVGVALMAKNLAVVLLIQGIGASLGQIFLGWVTDTTGSFTAVILICSASLVLGALLLLMYPLVRRCEDSRLDRLRKKHEQDYMTPA
ncbi:monocarboxylate transporter 5-like [Physella acuta]|uniref:monocarboxylate transporter 5-like n=1 Tax=Physella acuta TaxID=109671 RepID=UPI0027DC4368|nr:monocarboxylate transporter 5-like [Physella acuta]